MISHKNARTIMHQCKRIRQSRAPYQVQACALGISGDRREMAPPVRFGRSLQPPPPDPESPAARSHATVELAVEGLVVGCRWIYLVAVTRIERVTRGL